MLDNQLFLGMVIEIRKAAKIVADFGQQLSVGLHARSHEIELPLEHVEDVSPPSLYGGGYGAAAPVGFGSSIEDRVSKADVYNSPGWRRVQENQSNRPVRQPQEARHVVIDMEAASPYVLGDRVFHQKFGYGEIMGIEGDKLDIEFDHAGSKKVVARWVIPADQVDDVPF